MPHAPDLSGRVLDSRYELHALIGEGAFGRVYRGHDRRLARRVAVKVIKPWWSEDPDWVGRFEREAQLLARLNHPGIVQIFDVGQAPEGTYYVEELVEGESLAQRLRRGPVPPFEACELALQLCSALAQAHAQGVVHRDVKPANVLISVLGQVKVGDFGVATLAEGTTSGGEGTVVGTPRYMAPEQAEGRVATPATDVYSVGIVLYEMLRGSPPFTGGSSVELALKHLHDIPPRLGGDTPAELERIVLRALAKRPEARYASAKDLGEALRRAAPVARVERQTSPRSRPGQAAGTIAPTLIAPRLGPRRNINPAARRRTTALFALVLSILFGMIAGAIVLAGPAKVSVPDLQGFTWERAATRVQQAGLRVAFVSRFDQARRGTAIAQEPRPGTKADRGTQVQIVLSAGPLPVRVPRVEGENSQDARRVLSSLGLQVRIAAVPAPGVVPGTVTQQTPGAAAELAPGSTVKLSVAETPQWRAITSFSGQGSGQSVPFRIRGPRWRLVYNMHYDGTCALLFICSGPSAQVAALAGTWSGTRFDLNDGANQTREFDTGAGRYQLSVSPGSDTASWSITVEDYF